MHALFIDDPSEAVAVNLSQSMSDPVQRPYPLNFHERTKQVLKSYTLQENLNKIEHFTIKNRMNINEKKSKIMIFNMSKKYDFPPELLFQNEELLEYLKESKLLGIKLDTSLKWYSNTAEIYKKSISRIFFSNFLF